MRGGHLFGDYFVEVLKGLGDGERVHFLTSAFAGFERPFQIVPGDGDGQRIGNQLPLAVLVFDPRGTGQRHPHGAAIDQKLDIDRVGVPGGDGHDQSLIEAMDLLLAPTIDGVEIFVHKKTIANRTAAGQTCTIIKCVN